MKYHLNLVIILLIFCYIFFGCSKEDDMLKVRNYIKIVKPVIKKPIMMNHVSLSKIKPRDTCYFQMQFKDQEYSEITYNLAFNLINTFLIKIKEIGIDGISSEECLVIMKYPLSLNNTYVTLAINDTIFTNNSELTGVEGFEEALIKLIIDIKPDTAFIVCNTYNFENYCNDYYESVDSDHSKSAMFENKEYKLINSQIFDSSNIIISETKYDGDLSYTFRYQGAGWYEYQINGSSIIKGNVDKKRILCNAPYTKNKIYLNMEGEELEKITLEPGTCNPKGEYLRIYWLLKGKILQRIRYMVKDNTLFRQIHNFRQTK